MADASLRPPASRGRASVVRIEEAWYIACRADELGDRPLARTVLGLPLVLFRGEGGAPGALLDRCPHRNVPLSLGEVDDGLLRCAYHGWSFDHAGRCRRIPALVGDPDRPTRAAEAFACRQAQGFVWVWPQAGATPTRDPYTFPYQGERGFETVVEALDMRATIHAAAENALDVPHTAFLHAGLFRGAARRNRIEVEVRRWHDRVEAEYIGEPVPGGLAGRLLAPGGGVVQHWDRFFLPSIAQIEYALGAHRLVLTAALSPVQDFETRMYAVATFKVPLPTFVVVPALRPVLLRIFRQDARVLAAQTDNIARFGGEEYASTDVDVLGPAILGLLRQAERGWPRPMSEPVVRRVAMEV
ncbi:MAG: Rieske 2Fe-2S domain-containing protein [Sandaracinaceae bacterium]